MKTSPNFTLDGHLLRADCPLAECDTPRHCAAALACKRKLPGVSPALGVDLEHQIQGKVEHALVPLINLGILLDRHETLISYPLAAELKAAINETTRAVLDLGERLIGAFGPERGPVGPNPVPVSAPGLSSKITPPLACHQPVQAGRFTRQFFVLSYLSNFLILAIVLQFFHPAPSWFIFLIGMASGAAAALFNILKSRF